MPTTGAIPTTTGRVPVTTGQTGPAGAPLTFRRLTIRLGRGWRAGGGGDHVEVATSRACRRSAGRVDCPGFLLLGPSQIAIANEVFRPTDDEIAHAVKVIEATREADAKGVGAYVVDGKMIDIPFVRRAHAIVASARSLGLLAG